MEHIKKSLKSKAFDKHGEENVRPCGYKRHLDECFTIHEGKVLFWFNVGSDTKVLVEPDMPEAS